MIHIWDLDGTIWRPKDVPLCVADDQLSHPKWATSPTHYRLYTEAVDLITEQQQKGDTVVICTNQGGSPLSINQGQKSRIKNRPFRPYKPLEWLWQEQQFLLDQLPISGIWWSPGKKSNMLMRLMRSDRRYWLWQMHSQCCHKPSPVMLLDIWERLPAQTYCFWGDSSSDAGATAAAVDQGMPIAFRKVEWR